MMIPDCIRAVSNAFGVGVADLKRRDRTRSVSHARFAVMLIARKAGFPTDRIGRALGMDRSVVTYGSRRAGEFAAEDEQYALNLAAAMVEVGLA